MYPAGGAGGGSAGSNLNNNKNDAIKFTRGMPVSLLLAEIMLRPVKFREGGTFMIKWGRESASLTAKQKCGAVLSRARIQGA